MGSVAYCLYNFSEREENWLIRNTVGPTFKLALSKLPIWSSNLAKFNGLSINSIKIIPTAWSNNYSIPTVIHSGNSSKNLSAFCKRTPKDK